MSADEGLAEGHQALSAGRWSDARSAFETVLAEDERAEACFGLAVASWWLGENRESVAQCTRAYALFRRAGEVESAVRCAVWLAITYKANFANSAAANGWLGRAERRVRTVEVGPLHGWICHAGPEAASLLTTYFMCGDLADLTRLVEAAGAAVETSRTLEGLYRAPSVDAAVTTEVESTPLVERITDDVYQRIREEAHTVMAPFMLPDGRLEPPFVANLVVARRR